MKYYIVFSLCILFCLSTQGQDRIQAQINELKGDLANIIRVNKAQSQQITELEQQVTTLNALNGEVARNKAQAQRITELEQQVAALNALNGSSANFQQLIGASVVPVGTIMPYYGDLDALPSNWMLCDGSRIDDPGSPLYKESKLSVSGRRRPIAKVPNLDEYFVRGTTEPEQVNEPGGQDKVRDHIHSLPDHKHYMSHSHSFNTDKEGISWIRDPDYNYGLYTKVGYDHRRYFIAAETKKEFYERTAHSHSGRTDSGRSYTSSAGDGYSGFSGGHDNKPRYKSFYYIIKIRNFERPYLGVVNPRELNSRIAEELGISQTQGIDITEVTSGSAAATAGLKVHDIIIKVDNIFTLDVATFSSEIAKHQIGDRVQLTIVRNGREQIITVTLGARPRTRP